MEERDEESSLRAQEFNLGLPVGEEIPQRVLRKRQRSNPHFETIIDPESGESNYIPR